MLRQLVLVTGANGFIGRLLCQEMLHQGWRVRAAIRSSVQMLDGVENVVVDDIDGDTDWMNILQGVDIVIHLAARVHVMQDVVMDPLAEFLKVNLHGTENLARQAVKAGIKRLVYVSSIKVNGEETLGQWSYTEKDMPVPLSPYGLSKWQAEQALQRIAHDTDLQVVIMRPPLVYGPNVKGNFYNLLVAIAKEIPLPLAGARNSRSQVYVGNLISALMTCTTHPAAVGQTYLVCDNEHVSTALLVQKIALALGCKNRSFYIPTKVLRIVAAVLGRAEQVDRLFGSLRVSDEKLHTELDWVPPYTLEQGLSVTATWYRNTHKLFRLISTD